jgi:hypothetical protein
MVLSRAYTRKAKRPGLFSDPGALLRDEKISSAPIFDPAFHSGWACVAGLPEPLAFLPPCSAALANVGISICHGSKDEAVSICKNLL